MRLLLAALGNASAHRGDALAEPDASGPSHPKDESAARNGGPAIRWSGLRRARVPSYRYAHRPRQADARRHRRHLGPAVGRRWHVPLRPHRHARPGVLGRHPAAHGVGLAPHRPRLQLHPHRHGGPLPPHAGPAGLLPDGLGRQRSADRAAGAELLRRPLRPVAAVRPGLPTAREAGEGPGAGRPAQLRRAVRAAHRGGRAGLRGRVAPARALRRLAALLHDHRRALPPDQPGGVPAQPGPGRGVPAGGPDPLGRGRPHGRRPGRDGGPGDARRVPPARVPPE